LLGADLAVELSDQFEIAAAVHSRKLRGDQFSVYQADLSNFEELDALIEVTRLEGVINCAGLTKIDYCEQEPERASRLNTWLPEKLAGINSERRIRLIHVSTATVFDGKRGGYLESDSPNPLSRYSRTKLEGEKAVQDKNLEAVVARVSMFGWSPSGKRSLAEYFLDHLHRGQQVQGFTDAVFTPLMVNRLAELFQSLLLGNFRGVFHVGGSDVVTKYDFGRLIAGKFGLDPELVVPSRICEHPFAGERSPNVAMDNQKLRKALDLGPIKLSTGLEHFYSLYQQGYPQELQRPLVKE